MIRRDPPLFSDIRIVRARSSHDLGTTSQLGSMGLFGQRGCYCPVDLNTAKMLSWLN